MRRHHPDVVFFVDMNDCFQKVKSSVSPVVKQNPFGQLRLNEAFKSKLNINSPQHGLQGIVTVSYKAYRNTYQISQYVSFVEKMYRYTTKYHG